MFFSFSKIKNTVTYNFSMVLLCVGDVVVRAVAFQVGCSRVRVP